MHLAFYKRTVLNSTLTCMMTQPTSFMNVSDHLTNITDPSFPTATTSFLFSFWLKVFDSTTAPTFPIFSIFVPSVNFTLKFTLNYIPTTMSFNLLANGQLAFADWIKLSPMVSITSQETTITTPNEEWKPLLISIDSAARSLLLSTVNNQTRSISLIKDTFNISSVFLLFGAENTTQNTCPADFMIHQLSLYPIAYTSNDELYNITLGTPGSLYAIYKFGYWSQYQNTIYNLNAMKVPKNSHARWFVNQRSFNVRNETKYPDIRSDKPFKVMYPSFVPFSEIDQSYIFTISYELNVNLLLSYTGSADYLIHFYSRSPASDSTLNLLRFSGNFKAPNGPSNYFYYHNNVTVDNQTLASVVSTGVYSFYKEIVSIRVSYHRLHTIKTAEFDGSQTAKITIPITVSLKPNDKHASQKQSVTCDNFKLYIYEISIVLGSFLIVQSTIEPFLMLPSQDPVFLGCKNEPNPVRSLVNANFDLVLNNCNKDFAHGKNCILIPNCKICYQQQCLQCFPRFQLTSTGCLDCITLATNINWDPLTKLCLLPFITFYPYAASLAVQLTTWSSLNSKIFISKLEFSCNLDSKFCPFETEKQTFYFNSLLDSQLSLSQYSANMLLSLTEYSSFINVSSSIFYVGNTSYYQFFTSTSYAELLIGIVEPNFNCSLYGKQNYLIDQLEAICVNCSVTTGKTTVENSCVPKINNCLMNSTLTFGCILCQPGFVLIERNCQIQPLTMNNFPNVTITNGTNSSSMGTQTDQTTQTNQPPQINPTQTVIQVTTQPQINNLIITTTQVKPTLEIIGLQNIQIQNVSKIYFIIPDTDSSKIDCTLIDFNCVQCSLSNCEVCDGGYVLHQNSCLKLTCVDPDCVNCYEPNKCIICKPGFHLVNYACANAPDIAKLVLSIKTVIIKCPDYCQACDKNQLCTLCAIGFSIIEDGKKCARNLAQIKSIQTAAELRKIEENKILHGLDCSDCGICQFQTLFYCQDCYTCRSKCQCHSKKSSYFKGIIVVCPSSEFYSDYVYSRPTKNLPYRMGVDESKPNELMIVPVKGFEGDFTVPVVPNFFLKSVGCTMDEPFFAFYQTPLPLGGMSNEQRSKAVTAVSIAKTSILFTFKFLGNSLGQMIVSIIELNVFFTFMGVIDLPIPGYYDVMLSLSVDSSPDPSDMSSILSPESQLIYYALNCEYKGYYFMSETPLLMSLYIFVAFVIFKIIATGMERVLKRLSRFSGKLKKVIQKTEEYIWVIFETLITMNFINIIPIWWFFIKFLLTSASLTEKVLFLGLILANTLPCMWFKYKEINELYVNYDLAMAKKPNKMEILSPKCWWLCFHILMEEIVMTLFLLIYYSTSGYPVTAIYVAQACCSSLGILSAFLGFYQYTNNALLKSIQYFAMFGFSSNMEFQTRITYIPASRGYDFVFLICHGTKLTNLVSGVWLKYIDREKYRKKEQKDLKTAENAKIIQQGLIREIQKIEAEKENLRTITITKNYLISRKVFFRKLETNGRHFVKNHYKSVQKIQILNDLVFEP